MAGRTQPGQGPPKVEGTSIMGLCGVGRTYAPKKPVTVAAMNRALLDAAAEQDRRSRCGRR